MTEVGPLLASGRDGDIYEYGPGLVLRRTKHGRVIEHEARVIEYAAEHGFPVPRVHEVRAGGTEIVMERLVGPMMMDVMAKRPQKLFANARLLADLHDQLHEIAAPDWLRSIDGGGGRLLHLDLHPMNVMLTTPRTGRDRLDERGERRSSHRCRFDVRAPDVPACADAARRTDRRATVPRRRSRMSSHVVIVVALWTRISPTPRS